MKKKVWIVILLVIIVVIVCVTCSRQEENGYIESVAVEEIEQTNVTEIFENEAETLHESYSDMDTVLETLQGNWVTFGNSQLVKMTVENDTVTITYEKSKLGAGMEDESWSDTIAVVGYGSDDGEYGSGDFYMVMIGEACYKWYTAEPDALYCWLEQDNVVSYSDSFARGVN